MKITKEMTSKLIKYVTKVDVQLNPFDGRTTSAREFLRQIDCERFAVANPKLKISEKFFHNPNPPTVTVGFVDETEIKFDSQTYECKDMLQEMFIRTRSIDYEYEINNKSIDD